MLITENIATIRTTRWEDPTLTWGLVPTMGYLHQGHLSLVRHAKVENDRVAVSIYVNPTQFAPTEDLGNYPRDMPRDLALLEAEGVDAVFTPNNQIMYPAGYQTYVTVEEVSQPLEGRSRNTHFRGVTTIVAKLFNIIQPTRAYFGQKDVQQTVVIRQMVQDLNFNLQLVICPIVRENDGLAMSSRNAYLSPAERRAATILYRALTEANAAFEKGERNGDTLRQMLHRTITSEPLARLDYVSVANPLSLTELTEIRDTVLISLAVYIGQTRLIDNLLITHG